MNPQQTALAAHLPSHRIDKFFVRDGAQGLLEREARYVGEPHSRPGLPVDAHPERKLGGLAVGLLQLEHVPGFSGKEADAAERMLGQQILHLFDVFGFGLGLGTEYHGLRRHVFDGHLMDDSVDFRAVEVFLARVGDGGESFCSASGQNRCRLPRGGA